MADLLIYWRDYAANWPYRQMGERAFYWHSSAKCIAELLPGDRLWMVTSGRELRQEAEQAAFLVGVWAVREVIDNPDDDPAYPAESYRKRVVADPSASVMLADPIPVDHILRPASADRALSIGRFLQGPRKLSDDKIRLLRAAAGGELAAAWLGSKR
jgi:hypothetical protein